MRWHIYWLIHVFHALSGQTYSLYKWWGRYRQKKLILPFQGDPLPENEDSRNDCKGDSACKRDDWFRNRKKWRIVGGSEEYKDNRCPCPPNWELNPRLKYFIAHAVGNEGEKKEGEKNQKSGAGISNFSPVSPTKTMRVIIACSLKDSCKKKDKEKQKMKQSVHFFS